MRIARTALLALLAIAPSRLHAQEPTLPAALTHGFDLLRVDSTVAAAQFWARSWTSAADSGKAEGLAEGFDKIEEYAGHFVDYDVVRVDTVTAHLKRVYLLMRYERQPVFGYFVLYDRGPVTPEWVVTTLTWNLHATDAWPAEMWPKTPNDT